MSDEEPSSGAEGRRSDGNGKDERTFLQRLGCPKWVWTVLILGALAPVIGLLVDVKSVWDWVFPSREAPVPTVEVFYEVTPDTEDFRPLNELDRTLSVGENVMLAVTWEGEGEKYLLALHGDGSCRLWSFAELTEMGALKPRGDGADAIKWTLNGPEKSETLIVLGSVDALDGKEIAEQIRKKGVEPTVPKGTVVVWGDAGIHVTRLRGSKDPTPWKDDGSLKWAKSIRDLLAEHSVHLGGRTVPCFK